MGNRNEDVWIGERVVACPTCGRVLDRTRLLSDEMTCKCGGEFTALATKGFVATIIHDPEEDEVSFQDRMCAFQKQLDLLLKLT